MRSRFADHCVCMNVFMTGLWFGAVASAEVIHVDQSSPSTDPDGRSWCTAFRDLSEALVRAVPGDSVRVAGGTYLPSTAGLSDPRRATFRLRQGVIVEGGYAGCGALDPDTRDSSLYESILSGDLQNNDILLTSEGDCAGAGGTWYEVLCDAILNNAENSYQVVTSVNNDSTTVLDGFTISGGNGNGPALGPVPESKDQGSGINIYDGTPTIRNSVLKDNRNDNHGAINDHGGATIESCEFRNNFAIRWGGGLHNEDGVTTTVTNCRFIENATAGTTVGGGAVLSKGTMTLSDCSFSGNFSFSRGGAMYTQPGSSTTLTGCTFTANRAAGGDSIIARYGGAVYNDGSNQVVWGCVFTGNTAEAVYSGGGVFFNTAADLTFTDCTFSDNRTLGAGGAVLNYPGSRASVSQCLFSGNRSGFGGGALVGGSPLTVLRCRFTGNQAGMGAGALAIGGEGSTAMDSIFDNNTAWHGGAMDVGGPPESPPVIRNCIFVDNSADGGGGGLVVTSAFLVNCIIAGNRSISAGGGLGAGGAPEDACTLVNCLITGNTAGNGAGILHHNNGPLLLINCTLGGNVAEHQGGGVWTAGGLFSAKNSIFWANRHGDGSDEFAQIYYHPGSGPIPEVDYSYVQDWTGATGGTGNFPDDPLFLDPQGPDGLFGTLDDDFRLSYGSPAIDAGDNRAVMPDLADLDSDGDLSESTPLDLAGIPRFVEDPATIDRGSGEPPIVDVGAHEYDRDCNDNGIPDQTDIAKGTSSDCNRSHSPDDCDLGSGVSEDDNLNGVPDECELQPLVPTEQGCRYFAVSRLSRFSTMSVALRVTSPDYPCLGRYVGVTSVLQHARLLRPAADWPETVYIRGREIVPQTTYIVEIELSDGSHLAPASATTSRWGDAVGRFVDGQWESSDSRVEITDAVACLDRFRNALTAPPLEWCDLQPEVPDRRVDILDVAYVIDAFRSMPYPFSRPQPCP